jgi:cytoskeletal protein RodZ
MVNKKSSTKRKRKKYNFQFSFSSLLLLCVSFLFVLGWVFSLGIMVGRGFLPSSIESFIAVKEKTVKDEEVKEKDNLKPIKEEELTFYNHLIDKKEKAKKEVLPEPLLKDQDRTTKKTKV